MTATDLMSPPPTSLISALSDALARVPFSAPVNNKWDSVNALLASGLGIPPVKVKTYFVSGQKQLSVRLGQNGVARDKPDFGLVLLGDDAPTERYVKSSRKHVQYPQPFSILVLAHWRDGRLVPSQIVARKGTGLLEPVIREFPAPVELVDGGDDVFPTPTVRDGVSTGPVYATYTDEDFVGETGIAIERANLWSETLRRKGQAIFQGPPGTGKTYIASRLAKLIAMRSGGSFETIVFHSSYGYADFVAGLAPEIDGEGRLRYSRVPGRLLEFCKDARTLGPNALCVLVIDEINRADLSSVFGELMYALEYREQPVTLAHGPGDGVFSMPANVLLIGTMNTADRSVATFDHALRRRFAFIRLEPDYELLDERMTTAGVRPAPIVELLRDLNEQINDPNYEVGISFFMSAGSDLPVLFDDIWSTEVYPYLEELLKGRDEVLRRFTTPAVRAKYLVGWATEVSAPTD